MVTVVLLCDSSYAGQFEREAVLATVLESAAIVQFTSQGSWPSQ
jgi:predicted secreted protein